MPNPTPPSDEPKNLNDVEVIDDLEYRDLWAVPQGNLINACENAAEKIRGLRAEVEGLKADVIAHKALLVASQQAVTHCINCETCHHIQRAALESGREV